MYGHVITGGCSVCCLLPTAFSVMLVQHGGTFVGSDTLMTLCNHQGVFVVCYPLLFLLCYTGVEHCSTFVGSDTLDECDINIITI